MIVQLELDEKALSILHGDNLYFGVLVANLADVEKRDSVIADLMTEYGVKTKVIE